jgi:ribosomal protein S18 acetylase RimI-like enzyme
MDIEVRRARPEEYERVGDLTVEAYRALPVDHLWGGYETDIRDVARRARDAEVLVALDDGRVVGAVTLVTDPNSPWLEWNEAGDAQFRLLAVDPQTRARGIGTALVRACLERAAGRRVLIHTTQWMESAQRLYDRLGFERTPRLDATYETWFDPVRMADLPPVWVGVPFMAYVYDAAGSAFSRAG